MHCYDCQMSICGEHSIIVRKNCKQLSHFVAFFALLSTRICSHVSMSANS